jgi:uncharacterized phiE125 gp8 family phage protein
MSDACTRVLITSPTDGVTTKAAVKSALGITDTSQDDMIDAALAAMVSQLDPATGGWLGRALRPQTWELRLRGFPGDCPIDLPFPPLISITSVKYDDQGGSEYTLVEGTDYRILASGSKGKQAIAPPYLQLWPIARCDYESVRIRYQCGYALTPADTMPAAIIQAVTLGVRGMLSNTANMFVQLDKVEGMGEKRYQVTAAAADIARTAIENLLGAYRSW